MSCRTCKHLGIKFDHISGHNGVEEWRNCNVAIPWNYAHMAVPMIKNAGEECKCFELKD